MNFSNVNATNSASAPQSSVNSTDSAGVRVDDNRISWPDDGWYEVQSATSYNTMTEGGRFATLPQGTYNVINHTTGERFENISVGGSLLGRSVNRDADLLSTSNVSALGNNAFSGGRPASLTGGSSSDGSSGLVSSTRNAVAIESDSVDTLTTTTTTTYPDSTPEDFRSDQRFVTGGGALISLGGAVVAGPVGWGSVAAAGLGGLGAGYLHELVGAETVTTTTEIGPDGSLTRTETGDTRLEGNNPVRSSTTTVTSFTSGREVTTRTDGLTGDQRTTDTDNFGVTTVTVSTADSASSNSPRTNTTYDEDGVASTTYTSPTGGTYTPTSFSTGVGQVGDTSTDNTDVADISPEPASQSTSTTNSRRGNYSENDSNSRGGVSSGNSDFGSRTSQPGGMGGV